jgi:hypothetical protein
METFQKRQKEMKRRERQQDKVARRIVRKQNRGADDASPEDASVERTDSSPEAAPITDV